MFRFLTEKMLHKKWMMLCLLIGNMMLMAIVSCNPMYVDAAIKKMFVSKMESFYEKNLQYPLLMEGEGYVNVQNDWETAEQAMQDLVHEKTQKIGMPVAATNIVYVFPEVETKTKLFAEGEKDVKRTSLSYCANLSEHVEMVAGEFPTELRTEDGCIPCVVTQATMIGRNLMMGEVLTNEELKDNKGNVVPFKIVGVVKEAQEDDLYWLHAAKSYSNNTFVTKEVMMDLYSNTNLKEAIPSVRNEIVVAFDFESVDASRVNEYYYATDSVERECQAKGNSSIDRTVDAGFIKFKANYLKTVFTFYESIGKVSTTMWILQVPVFFLLAVFIYMVSGQMLDMEQNEIAMLKSRGVSRFKIIGVYFMQSVILAGIAAVIGLPIGYALCYILGASNSFMEFVNRKPLDVRFRPEALLFELAAVAFSVAVMTLPVFKLAKVTIVEQKRTKRAGKKPVWKAMFLDVILCIVSIYAWYNFNSQASLLEQKVANGESLDPMLFLSSSLFIFSLGLLTLRVIPLIVKIIYNIGKNRWKPAFYASFLHILRGSSSQNFIIVFMAITIALGIFNANTARTINDNEEERIKYEVGTDVVLQEKWDSNLATVENALRQGTKDVPLVYYEPDTSKYDQLSDKLESWTKVYHFKNLEGKSTATKNNTIKNLELIGINTKEFGKTAKLKEGLLDKHWYNYLNMISQDPKAVLVSENARRNLGLKEGDIIEYDMYDIFDRPCGKGVGVIYGFVPYFPGYIDQAMIEDKGDGSIGITDQYLIVANYDQVSSNFGTQPYEVWLNLRDGASSQSIYDFIEQNDIKVKKLNDTSEQIVSVKNDPVFQVTNGLLTISFIVVIILCAIGFLIYWILSIKSRELMFGIYRAMGMTMKEIIQMLFNEHIFSTLLSIVNGIVIGVLASYGFAPLIEIAYSTGIRTLPNIVATSPLDMVRLGAAVVVMIIFCIFIIARILVKLNISQALKLGEE